MSSTDGHVMNTSEQPRIGGGLERVDLAKDWESGMLRYGDELKKLVSRFPAARILELGAGRWPSFGLAEMPDTVDSYTVNDISADELARLPCGYKKACFDVCGDAEEFSDCYDIVFSRFLAEHVPDGVAMHRNQGAPAGRRCIPPNSYSLRAPFCPEQAGPRKADHLVAKGPVSTAGDQPQVPGPLLRMLRQP
jgi:hypothetical protein